VPGAMVCAGTFGASGGVGSDARAAFANDGEAAEPAGVEPAGGASVGAGAAAAGGLKTVVSEGMPPEGVSLSDGIAPPASAAKAAATSFCLLLDTHQPPGPAHGASERAEPSQFSRIIGLW
jgi:hypothetical protein